MIVTTTERVAGYEVEQVMGEVFGIVVRSRGIGGDIMAELKGLVGGEVRSYTRMLEDARSQAMDRLKKNAEKMGANAIISMRFDSSEIAGKMSEIVAYGTAVVIRPA